MPKSAYWSLICFPLMVLFIAAACVCYALNKNLELQACGLTDLAFYMLFLQVIWSHYALYKIQGVGDLVIMFGCLIGALMDLALIFLNPTPVHGNWLLMGSLLSPIAFYHLAGPVDRWIKL